MARKSRRGHKPRAPKRAVASPPTTEAVAEKATAALAGGRYKEAIAPYKELRKREPQQQKWVRGLERAYAGRARELASKDMLREALVIWEQRAKACDAPLIHPDYLCWLLLAGRGANAAGLFREQGGTLDRSQQARMREAFAARALSGERDIVEALGTEDPVAKDFEAADQALRAYCAGQDDAMEAALKRVPFRSPYRVFRQTMVALHRFATAPEEGAAQLERVPADSPFAVLCRPLQDANRPPRTLTEVLPNYSAPALELLRGLKGWSKRQTNLLKDIAKSRFNPNSKALFELVIRHRSLFGDALAQRYAWRLFLHYPEGLRAYTRAFGQLPPFALAQAAAIELEFIEDGPRFFAIEHWQDALQALRAEPDSEQSRLRQAMVLRRIYDLECMEYEQRHPPRLLEDSLQLDPKDRDTWVRTIGTYRELKDLKSARRCLDGALEHFPGDPVVLQAAVETAIAGGAFKKASRFAHKLLEKDSINPKVKATLLEAHLAHARKQIRGNSKPGLVEKELDEAANWAVSERDRARVELLRGLLRLEFAGHAKQQPGNASIQAAVEALGGGLRGRFLLLLEARRLGDRQLVPLLKSLGLYQLRTLDERAYVLDLVHTIGGLPEADHKHAKAILNVLGGPIERAAIRDWSETEMERVCETWFRLGELRWLQSYSMQALKHWRERPLYVFYLLYARSDGKSNRLSYRDAHRCEQAYDQAREEGDERTAIRISNWLSAAPPPRRRRRPPRASGPGPMGIPMELIGMLKQMAEFAEMFGGIDPMFEAMKQQGHASPLHDMQEQLGMDTLRSLLEAMIMDEEDQELETSFGAPELEDPIPEPAPKPKRKPRKAKRPAPPDEDGPNQGDLF